MRNSDRIEVGTVTHAPRTPESSAADAAALRPRNILPGSRKMDEGGNQETAHGIHVSIRVHGRQNSTRHQMIGAAAKPKLPPVTELKTESAGSDRNPRYCVLYSIVLYHSPVVGLAPLSTVSKNRPELMGFASKGRMLCLPNTLLVLESRTDDATCCTGERLPSRARCG